MHVEGRDDELPDIITYLVPTDKKTRRHPRDMSKRIMAAVTEGTLRKKSGRSEIVEAGSKKATSLSYAGLIVMTWS